MRISSDKDIQKGVRHLRKSHPIFATLLPQCGTIPLRLSTPDFEGLANIIISQQVSRASAVAISGRLKTLIAPLTADSFLAGGEEIWRQAGLSRPKQRTLVAVSEAIKEKSLDLTELCELSAEEALETMTRIKGIGPWTAEIYLMFCAGHQDVFPAGDLALQEAIRLALNFDERPDAIMCRSISAEWAPWRAVAARILWDYYRVIKRDALPV